MTFVKHRAFDAWRDYLANAEFEDMFAPSGLRRAAHHGVRCGGINPPWPVARNHRTSAR